MENNQLITYQGNQITMFSDGKNEYINITEISKAYKNYGRKSIVKWLKNKQTLDFLCAWENKHNPKFDGTQIGAILKLVKDNNFSFSVGSWIERTNAIGLFVKQSGTFAHKDIAIRFTGWLSPDFELFLIEEIQRLTKIEKQKDSFELLTHEQILFLIRLKEVFKYVAHQEAIETAHKDVFSSKSDAKNTFSEFHIWRNQILDISAKVIDDRIKQYCIDNKIALTKTILNKSKREKILLLDSYESVKIAVWDFLNVKGEINALNLATLVGDMIRTEKGEILRDNIDNLFQQKQDLGQFSNFLNDINRMKEVKTAREIIALREENKKAIGNLSDHNKSLKKALNYKPKDKG